MNTMTWRARARRPLAVLTTTALAGGVVVGTSQTASADEPAASVESGSAQWGVKASFRIYIASPIAKGEITVTPPATRNGDGTFALEATGGTVDGTTAAITFAGGIGFAGHDMGEGPVLEVQLSDVEVRIDGDEGVLLADVTSRQFIDTTTRGELVEYPDVALGSIDLSDTPLTVDDGVASVAGARVMLTEAGVPAFGSFYAAGDALDPLSFSVELVPGTVAPEITTQPTDITVDEGQDAGFTAAATGAPAPTVQWQSRTGADAEWQDVAGATGNSLTLAATTAEQDGTQVRAAFSNGTEPSAVTETATLTVVAAPVDPEPIEWEPAIEVFTADGVTPIGDSEVSYGDTVVVKGTGFDPAGNTGGRGAPIPAALPQGAYVVFGNFAEQWRPSQGAPSSARAVGDQRWALAESVLDEVPERFQGSIRSQWVDLADDGSFTAELTVAEPDAGWPEGGSFGVYTYAAGGATNADQELSVALDVVEGSTEPEVPVEWEPAIEVFAADGETPLGDADVTYGDIVVVKGRGFDPAANVGGRGVPIPATLPQGTYVAFGKFADEWQYSQGAPSSARVIGDQRWALAEDVLDQVPPMFQGAIRTQWAPISEDGSFTARLMVQEPEAGWPEDGNFGVYTYAAGGASNADQELSVPLNVVEERRPQLSVDPTADLEVGTVVTVEGEGYAPNRTLSIAFTTNTDKDDEFGWPVGWLQHQTVTTDALGSFDREITISGWVTGVGEDCSEVQCYLATFNSAQVSDAVPADYRKERDSDVFVPVSFDSGTTEPEPEPNVATVSATPNPVERGQHLTVAGRNLPAGAEVTALLEADAVPATGALDWGVKASFRSYVESPIAKGTIELGGGVEENEDGSFRFPAAVSSVDDAGTAVLSFNGSVSFRGHEMGGTSALEIDVANPRVQLTEETAVLVADVTSREFIDTTTAGDLAEYRGVVLADLDRGAFAVENGTVASTGAAATLTTDGAPAFGAFYEPGTELDPVAVEVTSGDLVPAGVMLNAAAEAVTAIGSGQVDEDGGFGIAWTVPATFPIGGYAVVLRDADGTVLASDSLSVLVGDVTEPEPEPQPEVPTRGTVVVEPDPVTQGATARVLGRDLEPGTRVGAVVDAAGAPGTMQWGVKESFRSYIGGAIATGSVSVTAPAIETAGGYAFGDGRGTGDATAGAAHFGGAVTFEGHRTGGVPLLELTITSPSVVIEGGTGFLVADVSSRSLDGDGVVDYPRVQLAELDLTDVTVSGGRLVGTDVAATLTAEGVPAFADFYEAGDALDPVTFSVPLGDAELDLSTLDVPEATVAEDGTVELVWAVGADVALGEHRIDLVTAGETVADTTFSVVAADVDGDDDGTPVDGGTATGGDSAGGGRLATTGADAAALAALAAAVVLAGVVFAGRRQRA